MSKHHRKPKHQNDLLRAVRCIRIELVLASGVFPWISPSSASWTCPVKTVVSKMVCIPAVTIHGRLWIVRLIIIPIIIVNTIPFAVWLLPHVLRVLVVVAVVAFLM